MKEKSHIVFLRNSGLLMVGFILALSAYAATFLWHLYRAPGFLDGQDLEDHDADMRIQFWNYLLITVLNALTVLVFRKGRNRFLSFGMVAPLLLGIGLVCLQIPNFIKTFERESFDSFVWKTSEPRSLPMARTLLEDHHLIGKTSSELEDMLGPGRHSDMVDNDNVWFWVINHNWHLRVVTENDTARYAYIWQPGMYY